MKFGTVEIPEDLHYTQTHLWVRLNNGFCIIGWTDYIQSNAGDVNYIELPQNGQTIEAGQEFGSIETSKWVDKLYAPLKGRILETNAKVLHSPGLINEAPFSDGWFLKIKPHNPAEIKDLMSAETYFEYLKACEV